MESAAFAVFEHPAFSVEYPRSWHEDTTALRVGGVLFACSHAPQAGLYVLRILASEIRDGDIFGYLRSSFAKRDDDVIVEERKDFKGKDCYCTVIDTETGPRKERKRVHTVWVVASQDYSIALTLWAQIDHLPTYEDSFSRIMESFEVKGGRLEPASLGGSEFWPIKEFDPDAPHALLTLSFVKENPGCTLAAIKEHLGIELRFKELGPQLVFQRVPPHQVVKRNTLSEIWSLVGRGFMRSEGKRTRILFWAHESTDNSSQMWVTPQGDAVLAGQGERLTRLLGYIKDNASCSMEEVRSYWKQVRPEERVSLRYGELLDFLREDVLPWLTRQGFVELDGPAHKKNTPLKLTEAGLAGLAGGPDHILRLLYS
jgi:hypothetical protein